MIKKQTRAGNIYMYMCVYGSVSVYIWWCNIKTTKTMVKIISERTETGPSDLNKEESPRGTSVAVRTNCGTGGVSLGRTSNAKTYLAKKAAKVETASKIKHPRQICAERSLLKEVQELKVNEEIL